MKLIDRIMTCASSADQGGITIDFDTLVSVIEAHDREGLMVSVEAIEPDHRIPLTVALIRRGTSLDKIPQAVDIMLSEMGFTGWLDPIDHMKTSRKEELVSEIIRQMDTHDCFDDIGLLAESELVSILRDALKLDKPLDAIRQSSKQEDIEDLRRIDAEAVQDHASMVNHMGEKFRHEGFQHLAKSLEDDMTSTKFEVSAEEFEAIRNKLRMTQLTQAAAMKFAELKADQYLMDGEIARFQMLQDKLCMPMSTFMKALSKTIGRPTHTHELVSKRESILNTLFGIERSYPSFEYFMAKLGSDVRGQIMEAQNA